MKKYTFPLLAIFLTLALTACGSGISPEDYEAVVSENASLKNELAKVQIEQVADQNSELDSLAWIKTTFGEDSLCFSDPEKHYLQCIAGKTYSIATEDIQELVHDLQLSLVLLEDIKGSMEYEQIFIKFVDSSGVYILEATLNLSEDSYILNNIMCDIIYADMIIPALQNIAN